MSIFGKKKANQGGGGLYLYPFDEFLCQKVDAETEGAVSRENKNGETVYELKHETVVGHITNVYLKTGGKFGNELHFTVTNKNANMTASIQVGISSSYATKFLKCAANIDFRSPVEFVPYKFEDKKKSTAKVKKYISGWTFYQNDEKVLDKLTKEEIPEFKKVQTLKGEEWDTKDALEYMWNKWLPIAEKNKFAPPDKKKKEEGEDEEEEHQTSNKSSSEEEDDDSAPGF